MIFDLWPSPLLSAEVFRSFVTDGRAAVTLESSSAPAQSPPLLHFCRQLSNSFPRLREALEMFVGMRQSFELRPEKLEDSGNARLLVFCPVPPFGPTTFSL